ncbi:MAG: Pseudomurein-binding repeat protein [Methanobacterium sp. PtaB.Bin024]|nr:MAG: Pseudomurein-binding repeat protein [Methanobacterium sp. PtaB.Bin024]
MESLTPKQYRRMVDEVLEFKRLNGDLPEYAVVDGCRIERREYVDMIERVNKFFLEMGRNPGCVEIGPIDDVPAVEEISIL